VISIHANMQMVNEYIPPFIDWDNFIVLGGVIKISIDATSDKITSISD
jgi:hypothetical protein